MNKELKNAAQKKYYFQMRKENPALYQNILERNRKRNNEIRYVCLGHYSNGLVQCNCCGEKQIKFLALDHINGGGNKHRKQIGIKGKGGNIYLWIIRENFPNGFQVLCHNCNMAKAYYGQCPHNVL